MVVSHAAFLAVALATHALVGYTLGAVLFDAPRAGLVGGVAADVDLLLPATWGFPVVHRGVTHTALAAGLAVALAARWDRRTAGAVGAGYGSQLAIDATTPLGIPVAYPVSTAFVNVPLGGHSPLATVMLGTVCLAVLVHRRAGGIRRSPPNAGGRVALDP